MKALAIVAGIVASVLLLLVLIHFNIVSPLSGFSILNGVVLDNNKKPHPDIATDEILAEFFDVDVLNGSTYPEFEFLKRKKNVGLCFSGGGSRSFEVTLGYLRGLLDADLLKHVKYISSVSGGSWANAAFTYHDENIVTLQELLGSATLPEHMTLQSLNNIHYKCARGYPVRADLIGNIVVELLLKHTPPDDIWVKAVHETFLKPAGISLTALPAWNREHAARTLARNPHLLGELEFRMPCSGRVPCENIPFPIINTAMLGPIEAAPFGLLQRRYVMMESTAMYVGFPRSLNVTYPGLGRVSLALGGLVEPAGFSSWIKDSASLCGTRDCPVPLVKRIPKPDRPFSIANATSSSSWAPGALVAEEPVLKPLENVLLTTPYFSPYFGGTSRDVFVGDGANMENQGLIALLQRNVKNICMFINTPTPLADKDTYHPFERVPREGQDLDSSLSALFGMLKIVPPAGEDFLHDQVFHRTDFPRVVNALQKAQKTGKGAVARVQLVTVENEWWGVKGGRRVNVLFVYLGRVYQWEEMLKPEVAEMLAPHRTRRKPQLLPSNGTFKGFPHLPVAKLHLSAKEANALADMSAYVVRTNLNLFKSMINPRMKKTANQAVDDEIPLVEKS